MVSDFKIQGMPLPIVQVSQFSLIPTTFSPFNFISRSRILPQFTSSSSVPITRFRFHSLSSPSPSPSPSPLSLSENENSSNQHSFEVSYLINTFGWPPNLAISKAQRLKFKTPEKPESVLAFFKRHKFTETQISLVVKKYPRLLMCYPEKTLLPKFGFLSSLGLSTIEITSVVTKSPLILLRNLEKITIPNFDLLCSLFNSYDEAVTMIKRTPIFLAYLNKLDRYQYQTPTPDNFRKMVEDVKEMGFDPCTVKFLQALCTIMVLGKSTWEDRVQVFKKYGWYDHEILLAFKKFPKFIMCSKDKIEGTMDFLVNTMGIKAKVVANYPEIFSNVSLEKTIIPRCLFYLSVLEKGLCNNEFNIIILTITEARFITRFIKPYENEAPELWDLYKGLVKLHRLSLSSPSPFSEFENSSNEHSFVVAYLMSTFGWPRELAIVKAKNLRFKSPEKPEIILDFFKKNGFTKTQISLMIKKGPRLLGCLNPEKTFLPKFEFLSSIGFSRTEISDVVSKEPFFLNSSLERVIIPTFNLLRKLVNSDDEVVKMIKQYPFMLRYYHEPDNIQTLLNAGVPAENILAFLRRVDQIFSDPTPDNFRKMVEEIKEMGFDPCTMKFLFALRAIMLTGKSTREENVQVLKKYGWSDRDILLAFEKYPKFITTSTDKIERVMDFLVKKMGFEATDICNYPRIFSSSLEKTIIPRSFVYKSLLEKGLLKRKFSVEYAKIGEAKFLARFIMRYEDEAPELWDLYNGKLHNGV